MKFILLQAATLLLALSVSFAQGNLAGTIVDSNGIPMADVNVYISSLNKGTNSDKLGRFSIKNLATASYEVSFTSVGYKSQQQTVVINNSETTSVRVTLEQGELVLADVVITDQFSTEINTVSQVDIKLRPVNT